jgi:MFS family permease
MAVNFPGFFALAADMVPPSRRTEGIALFGVTGLIPLAFNPLVSRAGIHPADLRWFFPLVGVVILGSLVFILAVRTPGLRSAPGTFKMTDAVRALARRPLWPVWLATIVFSGLVSTFFAFATVAADKRSIADPAAIWFAYAAGAATVRLLGSRVPDRVGTWNMVAPSLALYVLGALVLAGAWSFEALLIGGALAGMGHGYSFPVLSSQVVERTPEALRGSGMAMFTALWEVSALGLTPLFGLLADAAGDAVLFSTATLWAIVCMSIWAAMEHRLGRGVGGAAHPV